MIAGIFEVPASLLAWLYSITHSYVLSISLIAGLVMLLVTPLILKSTKGMLEMQRLAPEMRKLQNEHRGDRQKLNEEMMKLYQEHKVNPMASCLPLVAQMPVFIVMYQILRGLSYRPIGASELVARTVLNAGGANLSEEVGFLPRYVSKDSELYSSLVRQDEMSSIGLDLSLSPAQMLGEDFTRGLIYAALVVILGGLYFFQQRMVAARAAVSPTMSESQQKLMQYLPVVFAIFQVFFLLGLVVYYIVQSMLRILQQFYITKRFYGHEHSLGRQALAASARARELSKEGGGTDAGPFAKARRDLAEAKKAPKPAARSKKQRPTPPPVVSPSNRTTAPKNRPTPSAKRGADRSSGRPAGRPSSPNKRKRK